MFMSKHMSVESNDEIFKLRKTIYDMYGLNIVSDVPAYSIGVWSVISMILDYLGLEISPPSTSVASLTKKVKK